MKKVSSKLADARALIESCISPRNRGIWASPDRYAWQNWTRDHTLAAAPALKILDRSDVIGAHLSELARRQSGSGKIPILFLDDPLKFLEAKIDQAVRDGKKGFMLTRYLETGSVEDLSPWTKDSEFLFAMAALEHADAPTGFSREVLVRSAGKALDYVRANHLQENGLIVGGDWRDTNTWLLMAFLLSNNCLYYHALDLAGRTEQAAALKARINEAFWTGDGYRDYLGVETADTFGQALGVIHDVIPEDRYPAVLASFNSLHTRRGYLTNNCRPNPTTPEERALLKLPRMKQSFVIWPFIHGYAILALLKMGRRDLAEKAFREYTDLAGFWEYYDPATGKGYGAKRQLWSAALYVMAANALGMDVYG